MRRMLGSRRPITLNSLELDYVGIKVPMFSFSRLVGADPLLGVEMASTGEVGCLGNDVHEALLLGLVSTGFRVPSKAILLSLGPVSGKFAFSEEARAIHDELKLEIFATAGTATMLKEIDVPCTVVGKGLDENLSAANLIESGLVDLVINVPREYDSQGRPDGFLIRRAAIDAGVPLITDLQLARAAIEAIRRGRIGQLEPRAWSDLVHRQGEDS
jgi:carbamoyl-phosphate synthase large subunit